MTAETNIFNHISLDISPRTVLFRNNQGVAVFEAGKGKKRYVAYGVGPRDSKTKRNGGSDSIGWTEVIVTPEMVGKPVAVFTAIEIKTLEGEASDEQILFVKNVKKVGGYAGFASTKEEARAIVNP